MQIGPFVSSSLHYIVAALTTAVVAITSAVSPAVAQTGEMKPMAVIAATSYDELLTDIDYLGQFGGQVKAGQQLNNMLMLFTQNKGLQGLDKGKSWGAIVQTDGFQFVPVVCLPVTDLDQLLALAATFQMTTSDVGDGITEIEIPNQSMYVKKVGNWAFVAQQAEMLATTPENPGEMFDKLTGEYDVAVRVMLQNVPEMYRSIAVEQMRAGAQQGLQQQENETDEAFEARRKMTEANIEQIVKAINELDELQVGFNADSENGGVHLDFIYSGMPGTQVAQSIEAYTSPETQFAGCMRDDAAVKFNITVSTPPELLEQNKAQVQGQMESFRQQVMNAIDQEAELPNEEARQTVKDAATDLLDALEATAVAGKMDLVGHVDVREGAVSMVAGGFAKDTSKIESAIKKLAALVEEDPNFPGVNWDAESHAGAAIHTMSIPVPENEPQTREILGETLDIAIAIGDEVVYLAAGDNHVDKLKQAMDGSGSSSSSIKPMQFSLALTPILQLAAETEPNAAVDAMVDALVTKSEGEDQVHMTAEAVEGKLRARFELEKGVLEAIGAAAMNARRQGAAAGF